MQKDPVRRPAKKVIKYDRFGVKMSQEDPMSQLPPSGPLNQKQLQFNKKKELQRLNADLSHFMGPNYNKVYQPNNESEDTPILDSDPNIEPNELNHP